MFRSLWFKLINDPDRNINLFTIKQNRKIFIINNVVLLVQYLLLLLVVIYTLTISALPLSGNDKNIHYYVGLGITGFVFFTSIFNNETSFGGNGSAAYLIYAKFVTEKFKYFYGHEISFQKQPLPTQKYLKTKKIRDIDIQANLLNRGYIMRAHIKNPETAIKMIKASLLFFNFASTFCGAFAVLVIFLNVSLLFMW